MAKSSSWEYLSQIRRDYLMQSVTFYRFRPIYNRGVYIQYGFININDIVFFFIVINTS